MAVLASKRPKRWDRAYSDTMDKHDVARVLSSPHFQLMTREKFPKSLKLKDIIANDCRIKVFEKDQLIVAAGSYTNSAFLMLSGSASLVLAPGIDSSAWGQAKSSKKSTFKSFIQYLARNRKAEVRANIGPISVDVKNTLNKKKLGEATTVTDRHSSLPILSDFQQRVENANAECLSLKAGDIFGESAALGRTMIDNTVVASEQVELLEIRWQGLRDICKYEEGFKAYIDKLYRERGLVEELLRQPLFAHVPKAKIFDLAKQALFEVYGEFEWHKGFQQNADVVRSDDDINRLIQAEPVVAAEGDYPDGLLLIRNGFARISRKINHGHYTLGHLSSGDLFGLTELYNSWLNKADNLAPLSCSLRALGYTDVIRIPSSWLEQNVFSSDSEDAVKATLQTLLAKEQARDVESSSELKVDRKLTEFLVENRVINGTQAMMIDLERCVRCDDCVTACSNAHDNNPRFTRHGPRFEQYMVANACMHCDDPVCMIGCPTGAIHRSQQGVVTINDETCIGCSTCANSCPYDNIRMVNVRDGKGRAYVDEQKKPVLKATKCDLCTDVAGGPACERACSHDALVRIDVKDLSSLADWVNR